MSSKNFTKLTFAWLRLLKGDRDSTALAVGMQLIEHFNEDIEGGCAWPGCGFMAKQLGLHEVTVVRAIHRMHQRGRLRVEWGKPGRGHSNKYWMIVKPAPEQVLDTEKPAPAQENLLTNHVEEANASSTGERERSRSLAAIPLVAVAPSGAATEEEYAELRRVWTREWIDDEADDRKAFDKVCRNTGANQIIAGARAWAAKIEPRFLPKLAKWLDARGWEKPPPQRKPQRNGGKVSIANAILDITRDGGSQ